MTTTLDLGAAAILLRAADILDEHGHSRQNRWDACGYDALGAIGLAAGIRPWDWDNEPDSHIVFDCSDAEDAERKERFRAGRVAALTALRALLEHLDPTSTPERLLRMQLVERADAWNDDPARTREQVTAALRAAAQEVTVR